MKINKIIFKTLLVFTLIICSIKVYGNDLHYVAHFTDNVNGTYQCQITIAVQPHPSTVQAYKDANKDAGGWVAGGNPDMDGSASSFSSAAFIFHPTNAKLTVYGSDFSSYGSNINIYYDSYKDANGPKEIGEGFQNIWLFTPEKANIAQDQGTRSGPPDSKDYTKMWKNDSARIQYIHWKVVDLGYFAGAEQYTFIGVYRLTNDAVKELINKYGEDKLNQGRYKIFKSS